LIFFRLRQQAKKYQNPRREGIMDDARFADAQTGMSDARSSNFLDIFYRKYSKFTITL
jgi:hypothetical protein